MTTDPRVKWMPYYDAMAAMVHWYPTEWAAWPSKNRANVEQVIKDEPTEAADSIVHWAEYDKLRARLAPDPRRDWIIV